MRITLMGNVIYNFIFWRFKYIMHGNGRFHHSEIWSEMSTMPACPGQKCMAHLFCQCRKLLDRQFFYIFRAVIVSIYINIHSSFSYQFLLFFSFVRIDDTISPGVNSKSRAILNIFLFSFHQTRMALFS